MVALRCTAALLKRLRVTAVAETGPATGLLGDWCAKPIRFRGPPLVLCSNERSLLSVVIRLAPAATFGNRFAAAAQHRINQIPVAPSSRFAEIASLHPILVAKATNRSVLSSMTQLAFGAEAWLHAESDQAESFDLEALGERLCETPCSALSTHWPWLEAELLLTGAVSPDSRGLRSRRRVI
jgi:hypothetical protein